MINWASSSSIKISILANLFGRLGSILLAILFTPIYISLLGIEAYGIIGFYVTLQVSISFLELGLSRACNRQLAMYSANSTDNAIEMRNTLRTLEAVYWVMGLLIALVLVLISSWIANDWLKASSFSNQDLPFILCLIALIIGFRWPVGLYAGALMGLQKQVLLNALQLFFSVLNWAGSALILYIFDSSLTLFFYWQLVVSICMLAVYALVVWRKMPYTGFAARISSSTFKSIAPFVVSLSTNTVIGTILMQADKLIISGLLPLNEFGYYILASTIVNLVPVVGNAVSNVAFPKFSQLFAASAPPKILGDLYHSIAQTQTLLLLPLTLIVAFNSEQLLFVYLGDRETANQASQILTILVLAKLFQSMLLLPYAIQMAYGWLKLSNLMNVVCLVVIGPALYYAIVNIGMIGAALTLLLMNLVCFLVIPVLMHRVLLQGEWFRWIKDDFIKAMCVCAGLMVLAKFLIDQNDYSRLQSLIFLSSLWLILSIGSLLSLRLIRTKFF